jgi:hypothetical protein
MASIMDELYYIVISSLWEYTKSPYSRDSRDSVTVKLRRNTKLPSLVRAQDNLFGYAIEAL